MKRQIAAIMVGFSIFCGIHSADAAASEQAFVAEKITQRVRHAESVLPYEGGLFRLLAV